LEIQGIEATCTGCILATLKALHEKDDASIRGGTLKVQRARNDFSVNALPDGSRVILDSKGERVYALNATAGAAWDACGSAVTLAEVSISMSKSLQVPVNEEMAEEAIARLQQQNLVTTSSTNAGISRRHALATLGAIALPLVVSMTLTEQKAYAHGAGSGMGDHGDGHDHHHHDHDHSGNGDDHGDGVGKWKNVKQKDHDFFS
jgi:hypothetical protein